MNEQSFVSLVERACADVVPPPPPVEAMVRAGRRRRWTGSAATVMGAAAAVAAVVVAGALLSGQGAGPDPVTGTPAATSMAAPKGTRLVGANGVVVAVPAGWGTDQVGCDNQTPIRPTVVFGHHEEVHQLCAVLLKEQVPSVRVDTGRDAEVDAPDGEPAGTVGDLVVRRGPTTIDRFGFASSWIAFPEADVRFTVTAATTDDVDLILGSAREVADGYQLVPNWYVQPVDERRQDHMTDLVGEAGLEPVVVEAPHDWQRPGAFLRTDPAIGTPMVDGSAVTVVYAAGDLAYYATPRSLAAGGWMVAPATAFTPPVSRDQAKRIVGAADFNTDAFLRTLQYPMCGPAAYCANPQTRLVWLVVDEFHYNGTGNTSHLVAIDAESGDRLAEGTFEGTS